MRRAIAATALVLLAATGCGGGDKPSTSLPTSPPSLPVGLPTDLPSGLPSSAASVLAGLTSGECASIAKEFSTASSAFSSTDTSVPYSDRFKAVSTAFSDAADKISDDRAKAAMKTLARVYGTVADGMKGVTYRPGSGSPPPAAYTAAIRSFGDPGFAAAARTLSAYFAGGCK